MSEVVDGCAPDLAARGVGPTLAGGSHGVHASPVPKCEGPGAPGWGWKMMVPNERCGWMVANPRVGLIGLIHSAPPGRETDYGLVPRTALRLSWAILLQPLRGCLSVRVVQPSRNLCTRVGC
jgi:hypothetical protein